MQVQLHGAVLLSPFTVSAHFGSGIAFGSVKKLLEVGGFGTSDSGPSKP